MTDFNYPTDCFFSDSLKEESYVKGSKVPPLEQTGKFGQLKLFISELFFLCNYWKPLEIPKLTVLYIGAGPGHHLVQLCKMFPTVKWELYDLQAFSKDLYKLENVKLYEKYFEESDYAKYKGRNDIFLISDIRNLSYTQGAKRLPKWEEEKMALDDMHLQANWVKTIKPVFSSLKFRLPYAEPEFVKKIGKSWRYLDGDLYFQPWVGDKSSELRLVVPQKYLEKEWDYIRFEKQIYYFNMVVRMNRYVSPYKVSYKSPAFVLSDYYDSVFTIETLAHYFTRIFGKVPEKFEKIILKIIIPMVEYAKDQANEND